MRRTTMRSTILMLMLATAVPALAADDDTATTATDVQAAGPAQAPPGAGYLAGVRVAFHDTN